MLWLAHVSVTKLSIAVSLENAVIKPVTPVVVPALDILCQKEIATFFPLVAAPSWSLLILEAGKPLILWDIWCS